MYRCELCRANFNVPYIRSWREPMPDGFSEPCRQVLCPHCFEPYFKKASIRRTGMINVPFPNRNRACRAKFPAEKTNSPAGEKKEGI